MVKRITGIDFPVEEAAKREGDPPVLVADSSKLKSTLNWTPEYDDLNIIVKHAWQWEKKSKNRQVLIISAGSLISISKPPHPTHKIIFAYNFRLRLMRACDQVCGGPQKFHTNPVPRVGGIGIAAGLLSAGLLMSFSHSTMIREYWLFLLSAIFYPLSLQCLQLVVDEFNGIARVVDNFIYFVLM